MCGRYSNAAEFSDIRIRFHAEDALLLPWQPTFNIAPSKGGGFEQLFIFDAGEGKRAVRSGRWWFIPSWWSKPLLALPTTFNARAEGVEKSPIYRDAMRWERCLVPATGWREFTGPKGQKQPHHFHFGHKLFAFAGLWSTWKSPDGEQIDSFTIVTTSPSPRAAEFHDRMPLVLVDDLHDAWLDPTRGGAETLHAAQARAIELGVEIYPSNPVGNSVKFEGPEVIAPSPLA